MKRKVLSMLLAGAMALSLAACGNSAATTAAETVATQAASAESAAGQTAAAVEDISLTVWAPQEDQTGDNWLQTQCEAFAAANPQWNISFTYGVCSEGDAKTNVTVDPANAADVYMYANDQIPVLVTAGALAELGGTALDAIVSSNSETTVSTVSYQGGVYGVPFTSNTWFMYYDKSAYSEEDVKSLEAMLDKGVVSFPLSNSWYMASFYTGGGCTLFGADGTDEAAGIDFSGDKAVAVTKYLVGLASNKNFRNDADGSGIAGLGDGSVQAMFSGSWDYANVQEALGENMGVAVPPSFTLDGKSVQMKAFAGSKAIGVNPNSKYPQAAVALAVYLGGQEAQEAHYNMRNIIPTHTGLDVSGDPLAQVQMDTMAKASVVQPILANMANYWTPAENMGKEIVAGTVTEANAAEKTEAMNQAMNASAIN